MRNVISYLAIAGSVGVMVGFGCSSKDSTTPDTGSGATTPTSGPGAGRGGAGVASSSARATQNANTQGAGAGLSSDCTNIITDNACDRCAQSSCCAPLAACDSDGDCRPCIDAQNAGLGIGEDIACKTNDLFKTLTTCIATSCASACAPANTCNPITNEGCTKKNSPCDVKSFLGVPYFGCYQPPENADVCAKCESGNGPFCTAGSTCAETGTTCAHYCCDDADCGTGTCDKSKFPGLGAGACITTASTADAPIAACDPPAKSPSKGSCVTMGSVGAGGGGGAGGSGGAAASTASSTAVASSAVASSAVASSAVASSAVASSAVASSAVASSAVASSAVASSAASSSSAGAGGAGGAH